MESGMSRRIQKDNQMRRHQAATSTTTSTTTSTSSNAAASQSVVPVDEQQADDGAAAMNTSSSNNSNGSLDVSVSEKTTARVRSNRIQRLRRSSAKTSPASASTSSSATAEDGKSDDGSSSASVVSGTSSRSDDRAKLKKDVPSIGASNSNISSSSSSVSRRNISQYRRAVSASRPAKKEAAATAEAASTPAAASPPPKRSLSLPRTVGSSASTAASKKEKPLVESNTKPEDGGSTSTTTTAADKPAWMTDASQFRRSLSVSRIAKKAPVAASVEPKPAVVQKGKPKAAVAAEPVKATPAAVAKSDSFRRGMLAPAAKAAAVEQPKPKEAVKVKSVVAKGKQKAATAPVVAAAAKSEKSEKFLQEAAKVRSMLAQAATAKKIVEQPPIQQPELPVVAAKADSSSFIQDASRIRRSLSASRLEKTTPTKNTATEAQSNKKTTPLKQKATPVGIAVASKKATTTKQKGAKPEKPAVVARATSAPSPATAQSDNSSTTSSSWLQEAAQVRRSLSASKVEAAKKKAEAAAAESAAKQTPDPVLQFHEAAQIRRTLSAGSRAAAAKKQSPQTTASAADPVLQFHEAAQIRRTLSAGSRAASKAAAAAEEQQADSLDFIKNASEFRRTMSVSRKMAETKVAAGAAAASKKAVLAPTTKTTAAVVKVSPAKHHPVIVAAAAANKKSKQSSPQQIVPSAARKLMVAKSKQTPSPLAKSVSAASMISTESASETLIREAAQVRRSLSASRAVQSAGETKVAAKSSPVMAKSLAQSKFSAAVTAKVEPMSGSRRALLAQEIKTKKRSTLVLHKPSPEELAEQAAAAQEKLAREKAAAAERFAHKKTKAMELIMKRAVAASSPTTTNKNSNARSHSSHSSGSPARSSNNEQQQRQHNDQPSMIRTKDSCDTVSVMSQETADLAVPQGLRCSLHTKDLSDGSDSVSVMTKESVLVAPSSLSTNAVQPIVLYESPSKADKTAQLRADSDSEDEATLSKSPVRAGEDSFVVTTDFSVEEFVAAEKTVPPQLVSRHQSSSWEDRAVPFELDAVPTPKANAASKSPKVNFTDSPPPLSGQDAAVVQVDLANASFDFRPFVESPEAESAIVEPSWDSTKLFFSEYDKRQDQPTSNSADPFETGKWGEEIAAVLDEEKKENEPVASAPIVESIDVAANDELDPLGWPRSPEGLSNEHPIKDPFGEENDHSEEDDDMNLLGSHSHSTDENDEPLLENSPSKTERIQAYETMFHDEESSDEEEFASDGDDSGDESSLGYVSQESSEDENGVFPHCDSDNDKINELPMVMNEDVVATFEAAARQASASSDVVQSNDESTALPSRLVKSPPGADTPGSVDCEAQFVATFPEPDKVEEPIVEETPQPDPPADFDDLAAQDSLLAPTISNDSSLGSLVSKSSSDLGSLVSKPSSEPKKTSVPPPPKEIPLPPPPPPPPPPGKKTKRKKKKNTNSKAGQMSTSFLIPPPPPEKLKKWEDSKPRSRIKEQTQLSQELTTVVAVVTVETRSLESSPNPDGDRPTSDTREAVTETHKASEPDASDGALSKVSHDNTQSQSRSPQSQIPSPQSQSLSLDNTQSQSRSPQSQSRSLDNTQSQSLSLDITQSRSSLTCETGEAALSKAASNLSHSPASSSLVLHDSTKMAEKVDLAIVAASNKFEEQVAQSQVCQSESSVSERESPSPSEDLSCGVFTPFIPPEVQEAKDSAAVPVINRKTILDQPHRMALGRTGDTTDVMAISTVHESKVSTVHSTRRMIFPVVGPSPFSFSVISAPEIIAQILSFLGDPVAVCKLKQVNKTCQKFIADNEHTLMRDAVRAGGISMNMRPYFWLWVTLQKTEASNSHAQLESTASSGSDLFDEQSPSTKGELPSLERKGRNGKWSRVIERDVSRAFGTLPPHKTGARLRTDSIVRALVTWGRSRVMKRGVRGTRGPAKGESTDSGDVSLAPTDTVSDWGGVTPAGSFCGSLDSDHAVPDDSKMKTKSKAKRGKGKKLERLLSGELALGGNALTDDMKSSLQVKLSYILHALAAAHPDVGYCQGMDYVVAHILRILQDTIRWKAANGTLPSVIKSTPTSFGGPPEKGQDLSKLYAEIDRSLVVEETCFRVMDSFFTTYSLKHFYWPELRCLKTCCRVFEKLIHIKLPVLADHFEHHELNVGLFALGWFQTLFLYLPSMPSATVCHMWDIWLVERSFKIFFRVGTAILFLSQPILLNYELEGMMSYLNTFPDSTLLSPDILIACALQIKVTNGMLMEIEQEVKETMMTC